MNLAELRKAACLTQQELADKAGISIVTLSRIENGKQPPRPSTKRAIARVLKVKPQELSI